MVPLGGYGSGRVGYRMTVQRCLVLDVRNLARQKLLKPGLQITWAWHSDETLYKKRQKLGEMSIWTFQNHIILSYQHNTKDLQYNVYLCWTNCNFGRKRPWFLCPGCSRRSAKIYLAPGGSYFRCRVCHNLTYASSNESGDDMAVAWRRIHRLQRRLGVKNDEFPLFRPKGMHQSTFDRLRREYQHALEEKEMAFLIGAQAIIRRSRSLSGR